ncbi:MAG TPA: hypothetical protein PKD80_16450 [Microthrixaceae bacterium]|jgi:hypothetical protein|nr:hypothetical protein [Microthrixaceae bacterium]HMT62566.1 hypothetical protein [Microthrixaceae bacterium]
MPLALYVSLAASAVANIPMYVRPLMLARTGTVVVLVMWTVVLYDRLPFRIGMIIVGTFYLLGSLRVLQSADGEATGQKEGATAD